jgi:hypothetical protein
MSDSKHFYRSGKCVTFARQTYIRHLAEWHELLESGFDPILKWLQICLVRSGQSGIIGRNILNKFLADTFVEQLSGGLIRDRPCNPPISIHERMNYQETMMKLRKSGDDLLFAFTSKTTMTLMPPSQPLIDQLWNQFRRRRYIACCFPC